VTSQQLRPAQAPRQAEGARFLCPSRSSVIGLVI
jgi:hypothetical protein